MQHTIDARTNVVGLSWEGPLASPPAKPFGGTITLFLATGSGEVERGGKISWLTPVCWSAGRLLMAAALERRPDKTFHLI